MEMGYQMFCGWSLEAILSQDVRIIACRISLAPSLSAYFHGHTIFQYCINLSLLSIYFVLQKDPKFLTWHRKGSFWWFWETRLIVTFCLLCDSSFKRLKITFMSCFYLRISMAKIVNVLYLLPKQIMLLLEQYL